MHKQTILFFQLVFFLFCPLGAMAQHHAQCQLCGMDLNKYQHVRYTVTTIEKLQISTCGVQCGLLLQLNLGDFFDSATATTLFENRAIPVEDAWYVYKSMIITDMSPGFIAFSSKDHARRFVEGFGGRVLSFGQALDTVKTGFK